MDAANLWADLWTIISRQNYYDNEPALNFMCDNMSEGDN